MLDDELFQQMRLILALKKRKKNEWICTERPGPHIRLSANADRTNEQHEEIILSEVEPKVLSRFLWGQQSTIIRQLLRLNQHDPHELNNTLTYVSDPPARTICDKTNNRLIGINLSLSLPH